MSYSEKLKNPKWQQKRLTIFQRDKWTCTKCQSVEKELQVHHLDYIPGIDPWEYPDDMLTTLCFDCHTSETDRPKHEKYLLQSLKLNGFLADDILRLSCLIDNSKKFTSYLQTIIRRDNNG